MSTIINRSGVNTYYDCDGNTVTANTQPNVNSGAAINAGTNPLLDNVATSGIPEGTVDYVNEEYILGQTLNLSNSITPVVVTENTGYQLGVGSAIRAGYWNIYSGAWETNPTNRTYDFGVQDITTYINYFGTIYTGQI